MIPFFEIHSFPVGPLTIQVWGLLVALGILAGVFLMRRYARWYQLSSEFITDLALWAVVGAFIGARFFHVFFYYPGLYFQDPVRILKIWEGGLSSTGGFVGGALAVFFLFRLRKIKWKEILAYADIASLALWLGWGIGRIGCFLIHDHPGTLSNFPLAVMYPEYQAVTCLAIGTCPEPGFWGSKVAPRHDLGLYESLLGFGLFILFSLFFKNLIKKGWGYVTVLSWMAYSFIRFGLDFLRATDLPQSDTRYYLFTPAQWGMAALFIALTFVLLSGIMKRTNK